MTCLLGVILSVCAALLPAAAYAWFVNWLDRHEKEPWWMLALAFVIYQATRLLLGTELIDDASWALAVLVVAAVVLAYHLYCLRGDMLVARTVEPATGTAEPARSSETLEITAPAGADLEAFNEALRNELPAGFELRIRSHA